MNKIKKILIFVTCFCFAFVFLFSINFARPNIVKADYNLVNIADHLHEVKESYLDVNYGLTLSPNTEYKVIFDYKIISTDSTELYVNYGYGNTSFAFQFAEIVYFDMVAKNGTATKIITTPATFMVENPILWVREARSNTAHTSTVQISNIVVQFADENLGSAYEQGYNNGMSTRDVRTWTAVSDPDPRLSGDTVFHPDWHDSDYRTMPLLNDINPFGSVVMGLLPGTYRISFKNKASGYYPLMYDFQGLIYKGTSFNLITSICGRVPSGDSRASVPSLDVFNLSNSFYSFADARSCESIVFNVPSSWKPSGADYATVTFYMMKCDSSFNFIDWDNFTEPLFFDLCSLDVLDPSSSYNQGYADGYDLGTRDGISSGYDSGYDEGFNDGAIIPVSNSITTSWFTSFLSSTFDILNINIFPNVKLIYLVFIPIGLGVLALILKMARG